LFVDDKDFNVLRVYLEKESHTSNKLSSFSNEYENQITKEMCDIALVIKLDYSNFSDIVDILVKYVIT
jgi:hypothetical protein